jgi:hypothetical protein
MQRQKCQPIRPIPSRESLNLPRAEAAMAVIDHHVRARSLVGIGKLCLSDVSAFAIHVYVSW